MKQVNHYLLTRTINGGWIKTEQRGYFFNHLGLDCFVYKCSTYWQVVEKYTSKAIISGYKPDYNVRKNIIEAAKSRIDQNAANVPVLIDDCLSYSDFINKLDFGVEVFSLRNQAI